MSGRPEIHGVNPYVRDCRTCGQTLPLGRFPRTRGNRRGTRCRDCESAYRKRRTRKQRTAERDRKLRRRYGITSTDYTAMARAQRWRCAICARPPYPTGSRLVVDHCHRTQRVRGLLCHTCNAALGLMGDHPERLERAAQYLRQLSADTNTPSLTVTDGPQTD